MLYLGTSISPANFSASDGFDSSCMQVASAGGSVGPARGRGGVFSDSAVVVFVVMVGGEAGGGCD